MKSILILYITPRIKKSIRLFEAILMPLGIFYFP